MKHDGLKGKLIEFLQSNRTDLRPFIGVKITRGQAEKILQTMIPTSIKVKQVCKSKFAMVAAAPHVSYDGWSHYFCNNSALSLGMGLVIAKNFRDNDSIHIPCKIGRHIHVNRPTETDSVSDQEITTERATKVHERYLKALIQASAKDAAPLDLLVEFHSHHKSSDIEIATVGISEQLAENILKEYEKLQARQPKLPPLAIEPLHELRFKAASAKKHGSLRSEFTKHALHIEIPKALRQSDAARETADDALQHILEYLIKQLKKEHHGS